MECLQVEESDILIEKLMGICEFSEKSGVSSSVMKISGWSRLVPSSQCERRISTEETSSRVHHFLHDVMWECGEALAWFLSWRAEQQFCPGIHKANASVPLAVSRRLLKHSLMDGPPLPTPVSVLQSYKYLNNYFLELWESSINWLYQNLFYILLAEQLSTIIAAFHCFLFH